VPVAGHDGVSLPDMRADHVHGGDGPREAGLAAALLGTFEACTGRDAFRHLRPGMWWAWVPILGLLAGWGLKVWIGVSTGRLPLR